MATNILDKVGSVGALIAGAAVPCCFPFLSLIGSILGLSFLAPYEKYVLYAMQVLVVIALIGSIIAYRGHRKILPVILAALSTAAILYALNTDMDYRPLYGGLPDYSSYPYGIPSRAGGVRHNARSSAEKYCL